MRASGGREVSDSEAWAALRNLVASVQARLSRRHREPIYPMGWPLFFAKRPLKARNLTIRVGEPFPFQDIRVIQGYGAAYGVPDAHTKSASELDYVEVIDVHDQELARHVMQQRLTAPVVNKLLKLLGEG